MANFQFQKATFWVLALGLLTASTIQALLPPSIIRSTRAPTALSWRKQASILYAQNEAQQNDEGGASVGGSLMSMGSALQSQLASAFTSLDESDQYDAVLTGLCAKILDKPSNSGDKVQVSVALQNPIELLQEMNGRRIPASSRSIMALIDVGAASFTDVLYSAMYLCIQRSHSIFH
jgi:hypothetical protein